MPFAAALSTQPNTAQGLDEVCTEALRQLAGVPDFAVLFFSPHHADAAATLATAHSRLHAGCLIGCPGEAIIGIQSEVEGRPAVCLWLARWANPVRIDPFHMTFERTSEGPSLLGWPDVLLTADLRESALLLVGDPTTFPPDQFLERVNTAHRGLRVIGGMASGGFGPGEAPLLLNDEVVTGGAVGVTLQGELGLRSVVSQGCKPIGRPLVITRGQENLIAELGGKPALAQLQELWEGLDGADRALFQQGLHIGLVINEYQGDFQRGDFLVRNVMGVERESGAVAITDRIRVGQTVQFHVRDAASADEDLHALLQLDLSAHELRPRGALVFSCNGRGTRMFPEPNHDAQVIQAEAGPLALAGFFAAGELGPVGGQNFMHGFTASVALFEEK